MKSTSVAGVQTNGDIFASTGEKTSDAAIGYGVHAAGQEVVARVTRTGPPTHDSVSTERWPLAADFGEQGLTAL